MLVVDDDHGVRDVCAALLDALGFQAQPADATAHPLELAVADVVLLDTSAHDVSGPELVRQLCERRPGVQVLVMSGRPREDFTPWLTSGAAGVLRKPFGLGALGQTLSALKLHA